MGAGAAMVVAISIDTLGVGKRCMGLLPKGAYCGYPYILLKCATW